MNIFFGMATGILKVTGLVIFRLIGKLIIKSDTNAIDSHNLANSGTFNYSSEADLENFSKGASAAIIPLKLPLYNATPFLKEIPSEQVHD